MPNTFEVTSSGIVIQLGIQTESGINQIKFHIEDWVSTYGTGGTFYLWNKRSKDTNGYPVVISSDSKYVYWTPNYTDLAYEGFGELQLDYAFGTTGEANYRKVCTQIFSTYVIRGMEHSSTVPAAYATWVTQVENYATRAEAAAEEAEETVEGKFGDLTATAEALAPGSSPTAEYDPDENKLIFGIPKGESGGGSWGSITGTLSNQTDLQAALDAKQATLVSGNNIKTINGNSILGSGNIEIQGGSGGAWSEITGKPFNSVDATTLKVENNVLKVNTTDNAEQDNTRPITSSGVNTIVGNINALLTLI